MPAEVPRGGGRIEVGPGVQEQRQPGPRDLHLRGGRAREELLTGGDLIQGGSAVPAASRTGPPNVADSSRSAIALVSGAR